MEEFTKDLRQRLLTDEEIEVNLMLGSLLEHLSKRMKSFDSYDVGLGSKLSHSDIKRTFISPLVRTFEEKIFSLSRSSFVQYVPLLIMAHANGNDHPIAAKVARVFTEQVMSMLIFKAFNVRQKGEQKISPQT